jgi:diguanylate cyclase (GGDEF)-like protein/PAS domain S-box-containing protein
LGSDLFDDPLVQGLVVNVRDVSEREQIAATLREVEVRFQQAWEHSPIGMGMASSDGRLLGINPALCLMLGYPEDELIGCSIIELTHPDDCTRAMECMQQLWSGELADCSIEIRLRHRTGEWLWARATATLVRDATGAPSYIIGHIEDVTERRQFEQRLAYDATHDSLTGLPVRSLLLEHLELALAGSARQGTRVAALFIDLDHFKRVNDGGGHEAGDRMLRLVATAWRTSLRPFDTLARWGGDEFGVLMTGCDHTQAVALVERLRTTMPEGQTFSAGIATWDGAEDADCMLLRADEALYRSKAAGRSTTTALPVAVAAVSP